MLFRSKTLADYVLQNQGATIGVADNADEQNNNESQEPKPHIQIFRGGKEL